MGLREFADLRCVARDAHFELRRPRPLRHEAGPCRDDSTTTEASIALVHRSHQRSTALAVELSDQSLLSVFQRREVGRDDANLAKAPGAVPWRPVLCNTIRQH